MAADQGIRLTTAGAVAGVAAVASYEHAYALVRARGEAARAGRLVPLDAVRRRCVHRRAGGAGPGSAGGSFEPGLNVVQIALEHRLLTAAQQWPGQSEQAMRLRLHPHDQVGTSRRARPLIVLPCRLDAGLLKPLSLRYPAVVGAEGPAQASQKSRPVTTHGRVQRRRRRYPRPRSAPKTRTRTPPSTPGMARYPDQVLARQRALVVQQLVVHLPELALAGRGLGGPVRLRRTGSCTPPAARRGGPGR